MFDVDGAALSHWNKSNFQPERDETARVIYKPKSSEFFEKNLPKEDFHVMRHVSIEQPFFSKYNRFYPRRGQFCCKACGNALYSYKTKLTRHDGWPAFGACVDGAVAMTPPEVHRADLERKRKAVIRMQSFVRGCLARGKVSFLLGKLIDKVLTIQSEQEQLPPTKTQPVDNEDDPFDSMPSEPPKPSSNHNMIGLSLHSVDDFSLLASSDDSSFAPDDSFGFDDSFADSFIDDQQAKEGNDIVWTKKRNKKKTEKTLIVEFKPSISTQNDDFVEIHCHRCKSHLGNILEEENRGRDGETMYKERHRVNGRALKYIEDNLPKRVLVDSSLLFANNTTRRLMGLKPQNRNSASTNSAFLRAHLRRRQLQNTDNRKLAGVTAQKKKALENFFLNQTVH